MKLGRALGMGLKIGEELWLRRRPFLLYLKPTPRCDLRCVTCNRWQERPDRGEELSLDAIREILAKFRRAGCVVLTLWGGEPTLRRDLPEILAEAKRLGMRTSICTNANHLETRAADILPHLDVLLCSLDGHGALHDEMRGVDGLFERVVRGIEAAKREGGGTEIKVWASVHPLNVSQLEPLARLAADLGVGIEFFPLSTIGGYNDTLLLEGERLSQAFGEVLRLKREGLPVRNTTRALRLMQTGEAFACNFGRISIHVDHRGRVYSCEDAAGAPLHVWGDHSSFDPRATYASAEFHEVAERLRGCGRCRLPCVVDLSNNLPRALAGMFFRPR